MKKGHAYLLSMISDGNIHSGEELAIRLNISRAAIWKSIKHLESLGLQIEAIRGKGYCLKNQIELLSEKVIKKSLSPIAKKCCRDIEVLFNTDSTNAYLFKRLGSEQIHGNAVLAEYQSNGRGRRGNKWISPIGSGVCLSVGWRFDIAPGVLGLLSLYMGVAIARALQNVSLTNIGLKWPNDIVIMNKKLGGILLEVRGEASGPVDVIIGIGVNYELPKNVISNIDQPVTDICCLTEERLSRNRIAASLLSNVFEILENMRSGTNTNLIDEWRQYDCYIGRKARLILPNEEVEGTVKGVDDQGALLMSVNGKIKSYTSGEISLRVQ
jgi:BirA family transcriptional regulator, biotin operon repressor / biotin---[acetyl-CoA-carboxylase] ligase